MERAIITITTRPGGQRASEKGDSYIAGLGTQGWEKRRPNRKRCGKNIYVVGRTATAIKSSVRVLLRGKECHGSGFGAARGCRFEITLGTRMKLG